MKTIIAGSRTISSMSTLDDAIDKSGFLITEVVSGTAIGVDQLGEAWASRYLGRLKKFPADWKQHGRSAGYIRNTKMAEYADALIAIWDGKSKGTKHMIDIAKKKNLEIFIHMVGENNERNGS